MKFEKQWLAAKYGRQMVLTLTPRLYVVCFFLSTRALYVSDISLWHVVRVNKIYSWRFCWKLYYSNIHVSVKALLNAGQCNPRRHIYRRSHCGTPPLKKLAGKVEPHFPLGDCEKLCGLDSVIVGQQVCQHLPALENCGQQDIIFLCACVLVTGSCLVWSVH